MPSPITIKTLLTQYHVEEFISETPFGDLYRVSDERSNRSFALTLLSKTTLEHIETVKDLEANSARLQSILQKNLNKYFGVTRTATQTLLIENWVDGPSLKDIRSRARLTAEEAVFLAKGVGNALEALHKQNFIHQNLAPQNIRIDQNGEVVVSGAGFANISNLNNAKIPPLYSAPELLRGEHPSPAADIYSLAVILYEMTTGVWINGKAAPKSHEAIRKAHLDHAPPAPASLNPSLPENFSRMLLWALRKNPAERLKSTTELISALALSIQIPEDKIPPHASPERTPTIANALNAWSFLPLPKPTALSVDAIPLEERLASLSGTKKKSPPRVSLIPIFLLVIVAGFISFFLFSRPTLQTPLPTPIVFTQFIPNITPEPTSTPTPRPTLTNGGRIVFTCTRGDYNQLCMVNRDGTELAQLTDMAASNYYPIFTLDAGSVLFASNRNGPFDFFILNFSEREVFQVTNNIGNVISPDFSPDGRSIVFANRVTNGPTAIWMVNADGLNPRLIYTGAGDIVAVSWSPDGAKIAYAMNTGTPQEYEIYTMDTSGRNHLKISQGLLGIGGSVDWSPDGKSILVHAGPFGDKDIFKIDAATGDFVQLTAGGNNAGASYSPNGEFIVFNSLRNNDQADLYIMEADGSGMRQITNDPEPDWGANWVE